MSTHDWHVHQAPLDRIVGGLNNRTIFDGLDDLAASMNHLGLAQPVLLRPVVACAGDWMVDASGTHYQIVAGERRVRAARLIPWQTIPAFIRPIGDEDAFFLVLTENLKRVDPDPIDEANGYSNLITRCGLLPAEVAQRLSVSEQRVNERLKLLNLRPMYQDMVRKAVRGSDRNAFLLGHALVMAELDAQRQDLAWDLWRTSSRAPTVNQFRSMCVNLQDTVQTELFDLTTLYQAKLLAEEQTGTPLNIGPRLPVPAYLPEPDGWSRRRKAGDLIKLYADQLGTLGLEREQAALYAVLNHLVAWQKIEASSLGSDAVDDDEAACA